MTNTLQAPLLVDKTPLSSIDSLRLYQPEALEEYYGGKWAVQGARLLAIVGPILSFALGLGWDKLTGNLARHQAQRAQQLLNMLTKLGPFYIKIGQALSTRPDLVPPVYLDALTQLQDNVAPFPTPQAFALIHEELGRPLTDVYDEISPEPIASASLGQVYKAKLKTGEAVAIKVQRPGLIPLVSLDLYVLRQILGWAKQKFPNIFKSDIVAILDEFGTKLFEEMDYVQEGRNA